MDKPIWVDRIDVSLIPSCPHGLVVRSRERLGVTIFYHPDGEPCSLLNSLFLTCDDINAQDARLNKVIREAKSIFEKMDDPYVYSRLTSYEPLVKRLTQELENERNLKKLKHMFLMIMRDENAVSIFRAIGAVLSPEKNKILLNNVAAIYAQHYVDEDFDHLHELLIEAEPVLERNLHRKRARV